MDSFPSQLYPKLGAFIFFHMWQQLSVRDEFQSLLSPRDRTSESGIWIILEDSLLKLAIYNNFIQDIAIYRKGCKFLPVLNNEVQRNSNEKKRLASLENLVLIMFEKDEIFVPKQISWFWYYPDGSFTTFLPAQKEM